MKELYSPRLRSRHAWRPRSNLGANLMSTTKLIPTFLFTLCWTLRTATGQLQGTAIPLNDGDIQQIVDAHNLFRGMVEPPASNMQRIEWSSDLAMVAQNYAQMCMFDPNPNRAAQAPFDTVGENRAFGRTTNYTDLIERGWFVQRTNFDFDSNMCLSPGACDEYIQLVWAESNLVGCGAANCPTVTGLPILPNAVVFVCNYAPEGNIPGQLPYETGPPCSQCPQGMDFCVENSCSSVGTLPPLITTTQAPEPPTTTPQEPDTDTTTTQVAIITTKLATTTEEQPETTPPPATTTPEPKTTPAVRTTTPAVRTTTLAVRTTTPAVQTTTPTPPCPPTVFPPIIVTIKPPKPTKKPTSYTVWPWPTSKPDRTGTRTKSGRSKRRNSKVKTRKLSKSKKRSRSKSDTGRRRSKSKSKCTKRKKSKTRRMRGRG